MSNYAVCSKRNSGCMYYRLLKEVELGEQRCACCGEPMRLARKQETKKLEEKTQKRSRFMNTARLQHNSKRHHLYSLEEA